MASVGTLPSSTATAKQNNDSVCVDKILPEGINEMKIKDDKVRTNSLCKLRLTLVCLLCY